MPQKKPAKRKPDAVTDPTLEDLLARADALRESTREVIARMQALDAEIQQAKLRKPQKPPTRQA